MVALAACTNPSQEAVSVPPPAPKEFKTTIDAGYVRTEYAFGLTPLWLRNNSAATILSAHLTGLRGDAGVRMVAVSRRTSPEIVYSYAGTPEQQDPQRFKFHPIDKLVVRADQHGTESYYLIAIIRPHELGTVHSSGLDVTFAGPHGPVARHYNYELVIEVTHGTGIDPRTRDKARPVPPGPQAAGSGPLVDALTKAQLGP
jgi:hypothetical protein